MLMALCLPDIWLLEQAASLSFDQSCGHCTALTSILLTTIYEVSSSSEFISRGCTTLANRSSECQWLQHYVYWREGYDCNTHNVIFPGWKLVPPNRVTSVQGYENMDAECWTNGEILLLASTRRPVIAPKPHWQQHHWECSWWVAGSCVIIQTGKLRTREQLLWQY